MRITAIKLLLGELRTEINRNKMVVTYKIYKETVAVSIRTCQHSVGNVPTFNIVHASSFRFKLLDFRFDPSVNESWRVVFSFEVDVHELVDR